ncbi:hypothetical protein FDJ20_gp162 [Vibrio phage Thalassa]|uniref:Uncharacterized protein n=2 Tax=Thalassavirus TaxID=2948922 RepID=A0A2H5BH98_9CAUD|nr:hypothetical protein FDJ20_gp162 [Vibrio phage Thalassa]YP_010107981.1 hypothetical protein KNV05_gp160 [Vibrio phage River4]AUG85340.1 hypothetical protein THALASSA_161 [Vibrio phage Thalassa]QKN84795.1 hypothetical protein RIVER4_156 [Vibrio phage River4]
MVLSLETTLLVVGTVATVANTLTNGFTADLYNSVCILFAIWDMNRWLDEGWTTSNLRKYFFGDK